MAAKKTTGAYSARDLAVLEGLDAVRKRPGMYIGSNDGRGLMHCLWEIFDNSVDEALAGHCTKIEVVLEAGGSVLVSDNGRGIPVDKEPKTKLSGVELVLTKLHAGGKFGGGSYTASGGLHGVGASVVNALSSRLDVQVDRSGKTHGMSFRRGVPGVFDGNGPDAEFQRAKGLNVVGKAPRTRTGTRVRWWADPQVFTKDADYDRITLRERAVQSSFLVPGLSITLRDERDAGDIWEETLQHKGGITEYVEYLSEGASVCSVIRLRGSGNFHETVPVLDGKGHMSSRDVERELDVDIALQWDEGYDATTRSFVNVIATSQGGTHVAGFERALVKVVNDQLKKARILKSSEASVTKDDIIEGLTAVVTVRLAEPQFEGQTKEVLGTPAVSRIVGNVVTKELGQWFTKPPRGEKAAARAVLDKVAAAMRTRVAARAHRDTQRRKSALETSTLPAKLVDCRRSEAEGTELFIVEGDSALGTAKSARDADFQALLPIRGKILNVQKASLADMLKNAECAAIIQVIGGGSGRSFDLDSVRYDKIIVMSDADVDGAHIRCLLLTLIHRYLPGLLENGRVFAAVPPLHRIEILGKGGKGGEVVYSYSDKEMQSIVKTATSKGKRVKEPVQRYKGLGEMDARQLRETTMDPAKRTLRRMTVSDGTESAGVFDLLMGEHVAPRKDFIIAGAHELDRTRIDT
ncbi:MAG: type IIA DNA topoisomerase subunit B [Candidatus Nanopelagicales bacterium]|nr:type IIA DNA topoisomerase subunit B [Candidatus Nanopelagicales bacterium]MCH1462334.1 type IIA DNA topoisomerase subunit B [Candidatus Nanopelagicales bacterium]NKB92959.1 DNA gyrase subunit B [Candidatus Nanopelagicales bacterium]